MQYLEFYNTNITFFFLGQNLHILYNQHFNKITNFYANNSMCDNHGQYLGFGSLTWSHPSSVSEIDKIQLYLRMCYIPPDFYQIQCEWIRNTAAWWAGEFPRQVSERNTYQLPHTRKKFLHLHVHMGTCRHFCVPSCMSH